MWFGILGPLLVRDGDDVVGVPAGRQRVLLAALLVNVCTVIPADALTEIMWDGKPPAGAATTLRSHVMRLRRVLGPVAGARVLTQYPGYVIQAAEHEVDLLRFTCLCREGGAAVRVGEWARASEALVEALGLWRGDPLSDVPSELLRRDEVPRLEQLRLQAVEWRMDARLHLGDHAELVPELHSLAAKHPLRERFHAQLMLALFRCGRQAEALNAYQHARGILMQELGTQPGIEMRDLHQRILLADHTLAAAQQVSLTARSVVPVTPRELPAPVANFTGRENELAVLTKLLDRSDEKPPGAIVVSAIGGTAGVGKTALAVNWAHRIAERFADGQLYVNLRGYDPGQPMTAADALAGFLRALGIPGRDIPPEEAERAARYRSLLAGRRILVVLDNASNVAQVRPLLPGDPSSVVVVTSRDTLAGLVARDGAERLELDLLPMKDAVRLLRTLIGTRIEADPAAATLLADRCCRLPLALRVAAELAASRPDMPLSHLIDELTDQRRLDLLDAGGDRGTAVRDVFSWSYRHLDPGAARVFRWLSLHPGPDLDSYAAAALTGITVQQVGKSLDVLARAHLIHTTGPGRYWIHDMLRGYAAQLNSAQDSEDERKAALTRLFDHYLHVAATAIDTMFPAERHYRPRVPSSAASAPQLSSPAAAHEWLDRQRAVLVRVAEHTAVHGWPEHTTRLAAVLFRYLDAGGHHSEAVTIHTHARHIAQIVGDGAAEATALTNLGWAKVWQGRYSQAMDHHWQALALFREVGDQHGQARALNNLGCVDSRQGGYSQAADHFEQALALFREVGDQHGQAQELTNLGVIDSRQGRYPQAADRYRQALPLFREVGDQPGQAQLLNNLGVIDSRQGRYPQAAGHFEQALALCHELGDRVGGCHALANLGYVSLLQGSFAQATSQLQQALALSRQTGNRNAEAFALIRLGDVDLRLARYQQATSHLRQALALCCEAGDRAGETAALNGLGQVLLATGQARQACTQHSAALSLAREIGDKYEQAQAHCGLARAYLATSERSRARRHWQQALTLFAGLGAPEADQLRAQPVADDDNQREPQP